MPRTKEDASVSIEITFLDISCKWGSIDRSDPRPECGDVRELMITTREYFDQILALGPTTAPNGSGAIHSGAVIDGRRFAYIDYDGRRWTWELFDAHFTDGQGPEIYIGKWPD